MKQLIITWIVLVLVVIFINVWPKVQDMPENNPDFGFYGDAGAYDWNGRFEYRSGYRMGWSPTPSGKAFDVVYMNLSAGTASIHFDPNGDETLYLDLENSRLEKRTLGFWFEAPAREGFDSALESVRLEREAGIMRGTYVYDLDAVMHLADTGKNTYYRLVLAFTENEDGSGERYEFRLRIVTRTNEQGKMQR